MARRAAAEREQLGLWVVHSPSNDSSLSGTWKLIAFFYLLKKAAKTDLPLTDSECAELGIGSRP